MKHEYDTILNLIKKLYKDANINTTTTTNTTVPPTTTSTITPTTLIDVYAIAIRWMNLMKRMKQNMKDETVLFSILTVAKTILESCEHFAYVYWEDPASDIIDNKWGKFIQLQEVKIFITIITSLPDDCAVIIIILLLLYYYYYSLLVDCLVL
jgi:hypothetical protein